MTYTNHYISLNPYRGTIVIEWEKIRSIGDDLILVEL